MSYPINYPTPQGANVQIFTASDSTTNAPMTWIKPQGASFVWFTLIGAGGDGDGATAGGGSGAVTNFMCPAFLIPSILNIRTTQGGSTIVEYRLKSGTAYNLLVASAGALNSGGGAQAATAFAAMGFYQSIAGQNGGGANPVASGTTFLSGGGASGTVTGNYGYTSANNGLFQLSPIIVGVGAIGNAQGRVGCGGGNTGKGGPGMAVIITW